MKKLTLIIAAFFAAALFADEFPDNAGTGVSHPVLTVYTNIPPSVRSGDIVQIGDFQFVVLSRSDFERMQVAVDDLKEKWLAMNAHESGRVALHGKRGHTTITNDTIQVEYADGYVHIEPARKHAIVPFTRPKRKNADATIRVKRGGPILPPRLAEAREKRRKAMSVTNEVSVTVGPSKEDK